jgi:hypothetical protein
MNRLADANSDANSDAKIPTMLNQPPLGYFTLQRRVRNATITELLSAALGSGVDNLSEHLLKSM